MKPRYRRIPANPLFLFTRPSLGYAPATVSPTPDGSKSGGEYTLAAGGATGCRAIAGDYWQPNYGGTVSAMYVADGAGEFHTPEVMTIFANVSLYMALGVGTLKPLLTSVFDYSTDPAKIALGGFFLGVNSNLRPTLTVSNGTAYTTVQASSGGLSDYTWGSFAWLISFGTSVSFYVNGAGVSGTGNPGALQDSTFPLRFGAMPNSFGAPTTDKFGGLVSTLLCYDRALTGNEILQLHNTFRR